MKARNNLINLKEKEEKKREDLFFPIRIRTIAQTRPLKKLGKPHHHKIIIKKNHASLCIFIFIIIIIILKKKKHTKT